MLLAQEQRQQRDQALTKATKLKQEREKLKEIEVSAYKTEKEIDKQLSQKKIVNKHMLIEHQLSAKKEMLEEYKR